VIAVRSYNRELQLSRYNTAVWTSRDYRLYATLACIVTSWKGAIAL